MKPGSCIDIWDGEEIRAVVLLGEEKGKLRVVTSQGREMKIPEARVANTGVREMDPGLAPSALGKLLAEHEAALVKRGIALDLPSLWEVLADEGGSYSLAELSELALGSRDGDARATLLRRLVGESLHFTRKKLEFSPRSREEMGETLKRKSAEEEKARRRSEFLGAARGLLAADSIRPGDGAPQWPKGSDRFLSALEDMAVRGLESDRIKEAIGLLEDLGFAGRGEPPLAAFEVLTRFGVFSRDENLLMRKYGIARTFPAEVLAEAERVAAAGPEVQPGRRDLRHLECHAIDDAETSEVDDALSIEELGPGRFRLGVHISEPGSWIAHDSLIDRAARERATTYYLPEERILMLPPVLAEGAASLASDSDRPALSFLAELDERGTVVASEICTSMIHLARRLTYEEADQAIAAGGGAPALHERWDEELPVPAAAVEVAIPEGLSAETCARLARMARLARGMLARRAEAGALVLKGPDLSIRVRDGQIELKRFEPWTASWVLVSEAMILANLLAAEKLSAAGVPAIYRRQAAPDKKIDIPAIYEPSAAAAARKGLKRTEIGLTPGPHAGLGLPKYLQITSPLRRYQDLACQRQMKALLAGQPPPFDTVALWAVAQATDEAEKQAREIERSQREYWVLRYLEGLTPETAMEATITRPEERRTLVELTELVHVASIQPRPTHKAGRKIRVIVDAVNPRSGRLVLREVGDGA